MAQRQKVSLDVNWILRIARRGFLENLDNLKKLEFALEQINGVDDLKPSRACSDSRCLLYSSIHGGSVGQLQKR